MNIPLLDLRDVVKTYPSRHGVHTILRGINLTVEKGQRFGILGRNGSGKSTMIRLISGQELPDAGKIFRGMSVSWPLAFSGAFQGSLTGFDNLRFISRIYNVDHHRIQKFVEEFSELGAYFREPVKTYSSGMQARLAFALSLAIEFDCYLVDEIIAVGDARFHEKCMYELFEVRKDRAFIFVSHDANFISGHCTNAAVLEGGLLSTYDSVSEAYDHYVKNVLHLGE